MDYVKVILRANLWDANMNMKNCLLNGGYSVEVSGSDGKQVVLEVVCYHAVEKPKKYYKIGI